MNPSWSFSEILSILWKKVLQLVRKSTLSFPQKKLDFFERPGFAINPGNLPASNPCVAKSTHVCSQACARLRQNLCASRAKSAYVCNQIFTHCKYCVHKCAVLLPSVWKFTSVLMEIYLRTCASIFRYVYLIARHLSGNPERQPILTQSVFKLLCESCRAGTLQHTLMIAVANGYQLAPR